MTRGEIWWVDFGVPNGSEAGYRHPAIVVQNDNYNASRIYTTVVIPLSTNLTLAEHKDNLFLSKNKTKLPKDSVACVPLITSVDKGQLDELVSKLSNEEMIQLEQGMHNLLKI